MTQVGFEVLHWMPKVRYCSIFTSMTSVTRQHAYCQPDRTASSSEAPQALNDPDKLVKRSEIRKMHLPFLNYKEQQVSRNSKRQKQNSGLETSSQNIIWRLSQTTCWAWVCMLLFWKTSGSMAWIKQTSCTYSRWRTSTAAAPGAEHPF